MMKCCKRKNQDDTPSASSATRRKMKHSKTRNKVLVVFATCDVDKIDAQKVFDLILSPGNDKITVEVVGMPPHRRKGLLHHLLSSTDAECDDDETDIFRDTLAKILDQQTELLKQRNYSVSCNLSVEEGEGRKDRILDRAKEMEADLLVVVEKGGLLKRLNKESVGNYCRDHAPCPVAVVHV